MLANGTRIIDDISSAGTKYKVVFTNGEECYPSATDRRDAERAARALQSAQGRPVGNVPAMHCEPYPLTS